MRLNWGRLLLRRSESFFLPSKNTKLKIYKATVLPAVLYGCETPFALKKGTN
jgi:hypothetical protein